MGLLTPEEALEQPGHPGSACSCPWGHGEGIRAAGRLALQLCLARQSIPGPPCPNGSALRRDTGKDFKSGVFNYLHRPCDVGRLTIIWTDLDLKRMGLIPNCAPQVNSDLCPKSHLLSEQPTHMCHFCDWFSFLFVQVYFAFRNTPWLYLY